MLEIPAPSWVESDAELAEGLDLLGLRQPVQAIGASLLNGVTSVTPTIRYLSFSCWLLFRYAEARLPDRYKDFSAFAQRAEAALVMGNLIANGRIGRLVGPIASQRRLNASDNDSVVLSPVAQTPALGIYLSAAVQLGLFQLSVDGAPRLSEERGLPLAKALDETLVFLTFAQDLTSSNPPTIATKTDLQALGNALAMNTISETERILLGDALIPARPRSTELHRISTYASLFSLTDEVARIPSEFEFMEAATCKSGFPNQQLMNWSDAWLAYEIRDMLAATHEYLFREILEQLKLMGGKDCVPLKPRFVISALLSRSDDLLEALVTLGLAAVGEKIENLKMKDLVARVNEATNTERGLRNGIYRWAGKLIETEVMKAAGRSGQRGQVVFVLVAWILAARRVPADSAQRNSQLDLISNDEGRRVGIFTVLSPSVQNWTTSEVLLIDQAAEMMKFTVHQHLNIAWSRMARDPKKDVALLSVEEGQWKSLGKKIAAGRTVSRLDQSIGWMSQLGWIDANGVTEKGRLYADRAFEIAGRSNNESA